jgi:hypothetical protein
MAAVPAIVDEVGAAQGAQQVGAVDGVIHQQLLHFEGFGLLQLLAETIDFLPRFLEEGVVLGVTSHQQKSWAADAILPGRSRLAAPPFPRRDAAPQTVAHAEELRASVHRFYRQPQQRFGQVHQQRSSFVAMAQGFGHIAIEEVIEQAAPIFHHFAVMIGVREVQGRLHHAGEVGGPLHEHRSIIER